MTGKTIAGGALLFVVVLAGCGAGGGRAPATAAPTATSSGLLSQDADSETLCYAENITVRYDPAKPAGTHRCVRAGVRISVELPAATDAATTSDSALASVGGSPQHLVVSTHAPGAVTITSPHAGAGRQDWALTIDVS